MGAFMKVYDSILFVFYLIIAFVAPLNDAQTVLPASLFPDSVIRFKQWYVKEAGDYLLGEKPFFFVGIVWLELLVHWPLSLINIYGILTAKPWFRTTCLVYGVTGFTCMVAITADLIGSGKASDTLKMLYLPFLGFGLLAILRGFVPHSGQASSTVGTGKEAAVARKKRV